MGDENNLRDGFAASIPQTTGEIEEALKTGLLSLDANVLLNFYRYSTAAREALTDVLRAAGERVWVSHQAVREFWRNRPTAIDGRDQATEQLKEAIAKQARAALTGIDAWAKQTAVSGQAKSAIVELASEGFARVRDAVEAEVQSAARVAYDPGQDSVLHLIESLLRGRVGSPLVPADHEQAVKEGARRAQAGVPPGFRDAEKEQGGGEDGASGDYLVWLQSLKEAQRRSMPLVLVTGDEKEDWWWKHRNTFMGPRSELVDECRQVAGQQLYMLRPIQLIEHATALDVTVSQEAAGDVARASSDEGYPRWTRAAVAELLMRLDEEGREQADIIRHAAAQGGVIDREEIYEIAGYHEDRMLRGFTRPAARITKTLQDEGLVDPGVEAILTPDYEGGVTAVRFEIPLDVVEILSADETKSSAID